jgi:hypothetical protein
MALLRQLACGPFSATDSIPRRVPRPIREFTSPFDDVILLPPDLFDGKPGFRRGLAGFHFLMGHKNIEW